jgi:hypothetical protein
MRDPRADETTPGVVRPCVLVVGCSEKFMERCNDSVAGLGAIVKEAGVRSAARLAGRFRPLVIIMLEPIFAFDPLAFRALARNSNADLVVVADEDVDRTELDAKLFAGILDASRRRQIENTG